MQFRFFPALKRRAIVIRACGAPKPPNFRMDFPKWPEQIRFREKELATKTAT
jgi:hypothetical protein